MRSVEIAIENLYSAFSDTAKPRVIEACPCCIDEQSLKKLLATPLREIKPDDISKYASAAFLTVGDTPDYLYFIPRILEISAIDDGWWPDIQVTGRAISNTDPNNWSARRRDALDDILRAKLTDLIEIDYYDAIDDWLCAIARMGVDVTPYLTVVETSPMAVAEYYRRNCRKLDKGKLANAFWELPNEGHDVIVNWLRREDITKLGNEYV